MVAFPNLRFTNAVGLAPMPGTTRLVVWEREGRIYSFENSASTSSKTLVLNIANQCQGWDDSGLLGVAFHPGFATNRYMFVWYNWVSPGTVLGNPNTRPPTSTPNRDRLSRYTLNASGVAGAETVFIDQNSQTVWHNGGGMFFGDDGFLYITNGDDARSANNQRINVSLHSGVLRIDVDRRGGTISHAPPRQPNNGVTANYFIPNDNPFVGQANVLEEFFAIGLRSPHRMTFDPLSRRIFIGDVGEGSREEISVIEPGERGLNFQWNRIEGLNGDLTAPYIGINKRPIIDYGHSEGFAVIGGYVYRGSELAPELSGRYIFGDNGSKRIWVLNEGTTPATKTLLATLPAGSGPNSGNDYVGLSSFGLDANGELYMCQMSSVGGRIYKLQRGGQASQPLPRLLSQTGAFANTAALTPAPTLIPYDVASPLWSDGAIKSRWMAIPSTRQITFAPTGEWTFPNGSVFVKHFELPTDDRNPSIRKRLETRLLVRETNGYVYGATYKWRSDNSDADLLDSQALEDITIATATGTRVQTWYYPSRQDCLACHTAAAGGVLGVKTRQSNRDFHYLSSGVTDNQLRAWNHIGLFNPAVNESAIGGLDRLVTVTNDAASLELRVRSYLDANCSHCHRPGGAQALWDGRIETPLTAANIINGVLLDTLDIPGARNVVPGDLTRSIMHRRANSVDPAIKMPPLAKNVIDSDAITALSEWIVTLPQDFSTHVLVEQGSRWKYLDNNSDQGTAWRNLNFNDSTWAAGLAQLGYGDADEATVVNGGPSSSRYITTYFRQRFVITNAAAYTNLAVRLLRDDGAVGYLNGTQIFRHNMPSGTITRATLASTAVASDNEDAFFDIDASPAALLEGTNVIAVEIHQVNNTSSDISFDLELIARRYAAPVILRGQPFAASQFSLFFDAPTGIRFVIDASPDLASWTPVHTNTTANNRFEWLDTRSPSRRFYRARQQ